MLERGERKERGGKSMYGAEKKQVLGNTSP
jgi:hypothetical protein